MTARSVGEGTRRRSAFTSRLVSTAESGKQPRVEQDLRAAIVSGDEPPGTLIPIDAVARFFGVSQIPVREALKVLQGEGLVDHVPHIGYSVAQLTFEEFRELYEVRRALETVALSVAVRNARVEDEETVTRTHKEEIAAATSARDLRAYNAASRRFHLALIRPSGMARLLHMYESAWNMTESARPMSRVKLASRQMLVEDHDRMLSAFIARDAVALVGLAENHYEHLLASIASIADDSALFRPVR